MQLLVALLLWPHAGWEPGNENIHSRHINSRHIHSRHRNSRHLNSRHINSKNINSRHINSKSIKSRHINSRHQSQTKAKVCNHIDHVARGQRSRTKAKVCNYAYRSCRSWTTLHSLRLKYGLKEPHMQDERLQP